MSPRIQQLRHDGVLALSRPALGKFEMTLRRSFARTLADYRWYVLGAGGIVAFALGCVGFWEYLSHPTPSEVVYRSLTLFCWRAGKRSPGTPPTCRFR